MHKGRFEAENPHFLNRLKRPNSISSRCVSVRELLESVSRSKKGAFYVGLGHFYCKKEFSPNVIYLLFVGLP